MVWAIGFVLALSGNAPVAAQTTRPGFDCARASTRMERAICANPKAAAADGRMAARYSQAWHALSPEGRRALLANQRDFLRRLASTCDPRNPNFERRLTRDSCLIEKLDYRTDELTRAVTIAGGHVFLTLSSNTEKPVAPDPDEHNLPPLYSRSATLVQIDRPRSPAERRWNATMRQWLREGFQLLEGDEDGREETAGNVDVGIAVTAASPTIISASLSGSAYYGGPHPESFGRAMIWSLPLGRALRDRDLLWNVHDKALDHLLGDLYDASSSGGSEGCERPKANGRIPTLTPKTVIYSYDPYELGGYLCSGASEIPWSRIGRFMRPIVRPADLEIPRPPSSRPLSP